MTTDNDTLILCEVNVFLGDGAGGSYHIKASNVELTKTFTVLDALRKKAVDHGYLLGRAQANGNSAPVAAQPVQQQAPAPAANPNAPHCTTCGSGMEWKEGVSQKTQKPYRSWRCPNRTAQSGPQDHPVIWA